MFDLTIEVPVPLVLFITTLTLAYSGFVLGREPKDKQHWLLIGFLELGLAFACFMIMPLMSDQLAPTGILIFVILSFAVAAAASVLLIRRPV